MFKRIASFNCYGLGSSREHVADLVKQYDFEALKETWLFLATTFRWRGVSLIGFLD